MIRSQTKHIYGLDGLENQLMQLILIVLVQQMQQNLKSLILEQFWG